MSTVNAVLPLCGKDSADLKLRPDEIKSQWFKDATLLHFCSNTLTEKGAVDTTQSVLEHASANNLTICLMSIYALIYGQIQHLVSRLLMNLLKKQM